VVVIDAAPFPRDKVCAGWITPQVIADLDLDLAEYRNGRTLQAITGFRTGMIGRTEEVETAYDQPVSYGIRRCEFDHYLLRRSDARLRLASPIASIRRDGGAWIVNDEVRAPMLVGAGGHFCPVARMLSPRREDAPVVAARETEFSVPPGEAHAFTTPATTPELFFSRDLQGYGWCFRKQEHINVGFGSLDHRRLPQATEAFVAFLQSRGKIPAAASWPWRGHAYLLSEPRARRVVDAGVVLVGDAAGLAYPQSGEGIRPAIESGLMAAASILAAGGQPTAERLAPYDAWLRRRFSTGPVGRLLSRTIPAAWSEAVAPALFATPWLVRHLLLDRWFLRAQVRAMA